MASCLSIDRYAASFLEFRRMSNQSDKMKDWIKEQLDTFMKNDNVNNKDECRILGIGSGLGEIDTFILENLRRKYENIFARVLEPNAVEMDHFKDQVCSNKLFDVVNFDWRKEDALTYFNHTPDKRFHIIHLFHVLYYFDENEVDIVIQCCFSQLEDGGHLLIIQGSATNDVIYIRKTFYNELGLKGSLNSLCGEDLLHKMCERGYTFDTDVIRASLDVSTCLNLTPDHGNLLWDFITSVENFCEGSAPILVHKIRKLVAAELCFVFEGRTYLQVDSIGVNLRKAIPK